MAVRSCRDWHTSAARGPSRDFHLSLDFARLASLCSSRSSPLRRHVASVSVLPRGGLMLLDALRLLRLLPALTGIEATLYADELHWLQLEQGHARALVDLKAAFPPQLRTLKLTLPAVNSPADRQLLLDALPVMTELEVLALRENNDITSATEALHSLSLEPLLQLPHLTHLRIGIERLSADQLALVKQISSLRVLQADDIRWNAFQLLELSRSPHRLQQLEEIRTPDDGASPWNAMLSSAEMASLLHLSGLTALRAHRLCASAFPFLPRFPRLRSLHIRANHETSQRRQEVEAAIDALPQCATLTELTVQYGRYSEVDWARLVHSARGLRALHLEQCSLPTLRFLREAPSITALRLADCTSVRPGHLAMLGRALPLLSSLSVIRCESLLLDEWELAGLTPLTSLLPALRSLLYEAHPADECDRDDDDHDEQSEDE
jgi:hypothetical protein